MMQTIPVFRPDFGAQELMSIKEVLQSGWAGLGPKTAAFEDAFSAFVGSRHAVAVNNCTSALHLSICLLDLHEKDEVITTPITFVSTVQAIVQCGGRPVFADVQPDTLNIDPDSVESLISPRTKAIVCVHYAGHPCEMDRLRSIARMHHVRLIEDAAHACGAVFGGRRIGGLGNMTCFSFHAVKNLACGDGGMITLESGSEDKRLRRLRWLGIDKTTWGRSKDRAYAWRYSIHDMGYKYHMNDLTAAIGLVQLDKLERANAVRRRIAGRYTRALQMVEWLRPPVERANVRSSWHIYKAELPNEKTRDRFIRHLAEKGISTGVHYFPVHLHDFYRQFRRERLPVAESKWRRIVSLPIFPSLRADQQAQVIAAIKNFPA